MVRGSFSCALFQSSKAAERVLTQSAAQQQSSVLILYAATLVGLGRSSHFTHVTEKLATVAKDAGNIYMAEDFACSAAESERIVCYCFCTYPLAALREKDLKDHPTDTDPMSHFHLPLEAPRLITAANRPNYEQWFGQLHEACTRVRSAAEMKAFELKMEAEFRHIEKSMRAARDGVRAMKEAYDTEVLRAIEETTSKSLYQWEPEPGSLSSMIWHFHEHSSEQLFNVDFECPLRISIESRIPSLAHCSLHIGPAQSGRLRAENASRELAIAQGSGQAVLANPSGDLEGVLGNHNPPAGLDGIPRPQEDSTKPAADAKPLLDHPARQEPLKMEGAQPEGRSGRAEPQYRGKENGAMKQHIGEIALPLFEQKSQEMCMILKAAGEALPFIDKFRPMDWTKCLGAHLGRFANAEEIITEVTRRSREVMYSRGEELKAMETKAALHFHRGQVEECLQACKAVIERYDDPNYSELLLTAVYYYVTIADYDEKEAAEQEKLILEWVSVVPESNNAANMVLMTCVFGKIAYNQRDYRKAERHFADAQYLLETVCNRPFLSAMNNFYLARAYSELRRNDKALKHHNEAEAFFSANLSKSLWRAMNFNWMGEVMRDLHNNRRATEAKEKANEILENYFPSNIYYADNLAELAELHENKRREEITYREKARTAYILHHPKDLKALQNLMRLGNLYGQRNSTLQKAKSLLIEANNSLVANYPASVEVGINLLFLAELCEKAECAAEAVQFANSAVKALAHLDTEEAKEAVIRAEKISGNDNVAKKMKREATS